MLAGSCLRNTNTQSVVYCGAVASKRALFEAAWYHRIHLPFLLNLIRLKLVEFYSVGPSEYSTS